jgi:tetratricopeptide (TPR) repeat protein
MNYPRRAPAQPPDASVKNEPARRDLEVQDLLLDAVRHHRAGQLTQAARIYRQILAIDNQQADCLHLLGMVAYQAGGHDLAVTMIRKAIAIKVASKADQASYHSNLGTVFQAQGKIEEATACYERALTLAPDLAEIHFNLGNIFQSQNKLNQAIGCYQRALSLQPKLAEAHVCMGTALQATALQIDVLQATAFQALDLQNTGEDTLAKAVKCYTRALALKPNSAKAHYNLGCALHSLGQADAALVEYGIALSLQPGYIAAGFRQALAQLLNGDFASGWQNYEKRWRAYPKDHGTPIRTYLQPLWNGEHLPSGRLLIWGEQGVGDEIMFAGLIPDVTRTGIRLVLECDVRLRTLFARSFPGIEVVSSPLSGHPNVAQSGLSQLKELDIASHLACGSLPGLLRTSTAAFAATTSPYLFADPKARAQIRARYADADGKLLVGLAWHTNNRKTGRSRSIDLSWFAPLFARPDIRWISLQYGDHDQLQKQAKGVDAPLVVDESVDQLLNIDIFAAQIAAMDMVITIDNSTAHLAGALGVPTWVLLPFAADWRWLREREDSVWYPTLRLFRQPKRGDWQSVVQKVQSLLSAIHPQLSPTG